MLRCDSELQQSQTLQCPQAGVPSCCAPLCSVTDPALLSWALHTIICSGKKKPSPFLCLTQQSCIFWTICVLPFIPISFHSLLPFSGMNTPFISISSFTHYFLFCTFFYPIPHFSCCLPAPPHLLFYISYRVALPQLCSLVD